MKIYKLQAFDPSPRGEMIERHVLIDLSEEEVVMWLVSYTNSGYFCTVTIIKDYA